MIRRKLTMTLLSTLASLGVISSPVSAEWFVDLFVGPAFTSRDDISLKPPGFNIRLKDVNRKNSVTYGGRVGHWFESAPYLGFALDVSHFRPDVAKQTVTDCVSGGGCFPLPIRHMDLATTGISFDALLRWPLLTSKEFPKGKLQPYLTIGPTIFITRIKISDPLIFVAPRNSDTDTTVGVKAGTGVAWQIHKHVALFGEYRFTYFRPDFVIRDAVLLKTPITTNITTNHIVFGISFRF